MVKQRSIADVKVTPRKRQDRVEVTTRRARFEINAKYGRKGAR